MNDLQDQEMEETNSIDEELKPLNNDEEENSEENSIDEKEHKDEKLYSQDEVDEIVKKRLSRERKRFNKIFDEDEFNKDLIRREKEITLREMKAAAREFLSQVNVPPEFFNLINFTDWETVEQSLKVIENIKDSFIDPWIDKEVSERLRGKTPTKASNSVHDPLKDVFKL